MPTIACKGFSGRKRLTILHTMASTTQDQADISSCRHVQFDTDSYLIGVDNRTSYTMTPNLEDFITPIQSVNNMHVQGIGGTLKVLGKGSVAWNITDDSGVRHKIIIPNTLYVRGLNHRLLSPQHWSQTANDNFPAKKGTRSITYDDELVLEWQQKITTCFKIAFGS